MNRIDRKARIREYKETARPAGIYRVRNAAAGKSLIGWSKNLPGILNRQRFQLESGMHPDPELQRDWNEQAADAFEFEELDRLEPKDEADYDAAEDLEALMEMWIERLTASGERLYPRSGQGA
jgi:hypothetical protein